MALDAYTLNHASVVKIAKAIRRINGDEGRRPLGKGRVSIRAEQTKILMGKTDEAIAQFASGTVSVYYLDTAATVPPANETYILDAGYDIEAFSLFGDVAITKWVLLVWVGFWLIAQAECA